MGLLSRDAHAPPRPGNHGVELLVGGGMLVILTGMVVALPPLFVVAAIVGIAAAVVFVARPEVGLLGYFAFRIVADLLWWVPVRVGGLSVLELLSGGVTALAGGVFYLQLRKVERHPVFGVLMAYLLVMVLSAVRSGDPKAAAEILSEYTSPFLIMFLVTALYRTPEQWRRVLVLITGVGFIPLAVSLFEMVSGQMSQVSLTGIGRLIGGYESLHTHGHMMLLFTTLNVFWFYQIKEGWKKWAMLGAAGLTLLCLYLSYVRTPLLGFAVFAVLFPVLEKRWSHLALVLLGAVAAIASSETMRARLSDLVLVFEPGDVRIDYFRLGSGRMGIWTVSMSNYLKQPPFDLVLGAGLGGHWAMVQSYVDKYRSVRGGTLNPHNDYLSLLYQLGPVSVISYIWIQFSVIYYALRLKRLTRDPFISSFASYAASLTSLVFVTNSVSSSFLERVTPAMVLWTVAGLLFAQYQYELARARAAPEPLRALPPERT